MNFAISVAIFNCLLKQKGKWVSDRQKLLPNSTIKRKVFRRKCRIQTQLRTLGHVQWLP